MHLWRGCVNALQACDDLLVEFQVKDEGYAKGLYQEAALGQMDRLSEETLRGGVRERERLRFTFTDLLLAST